MDIAKAVNFNIKGLHHRWFPNSFILFLKIARAASGHFIIHIQVRRK